MEVSLLPTGKGIEVVPFLVYSFHMTLENGTNIFEDPAQSFVNERGNLVKGYITSTGSRYIFDFNYFVKNTGWKQFDTKQDASYFGIWVPEEDRRIVTYAEGDLPGSAMDQPWIRRTSNWMPSPRRTMMRPRNSLP